MLQRFADGKQRLRIFWSVGTMNDAMDEISFATLRYHLNKNKQRNLKRYDRIGLVNPYTREKLGVYDPKEFDWNG